MTFACYAIVPSLAPHRGDQRRMVEPYFTTLGVSYADLNTANHAMRDLQARGISCHLEVFDNMGRL